MVNQPHLYSIATNQQITIKCDGRYEHRNNKYSNNKITLGECKLTTPDMMIQSKETIFERDMEYIYRRLT